MKFGFISLLLLPITWPLNGYAVASLWSWFIVPLGMIPITITHGIGIGMIMSYLTHQLSNDTFDETSDKNKIGAIIFGFVKPLFALFFGFIIHNFMTQ